MSKRNNTPGVEARLPLFLFLVGTLSFSLSSLPSPIDNGHFTVTSLSSEFASDCENKVNEIDGGAKGGSCVISPVSTRDDDAKLTGTADFQLVPVNHRDPKDFNHIVTSMEWKITTKIVCEGKFCPGGQQREITIVNNQDQEGYRSITSKVVAAYSKGATEMAARTKEAKKLAEIEQAKKLKRERCETDSRDRKIDGKDRMSCRVARLDHMDDEEAADYYEKYILPEVESMVGSSDVRKQRAGMALLKQLNASEVGGDFVKESVADLARFGQFKYQSDQQKLQIMAMNPNDPRRQGLVEQMRTSQFQADMYFRSRGLQIDNQDWGMGSGFGLDYAGLMTSNLTNFQNRIDQNYAALLQQHQYLIMGNNMQPQVQNPNTVNNPNLVNNPAAQAPVQPWANNQNNQMGPPPPPPQTQQPVQNSQTTPAQWAAMTPAQKAASQVNANIANNQNNAQFNPAAAPSTSLQSSQGQVVINRAVSKR